MKNITIILALAIHFLSYSKAIAQDALLTQWEMMPLHFNPALTGNFEGKLRVRAKYRSQWGTLLEDNSYETYAASVDYKFNEDNQRKVNLGFYTIMDRAGETDYRTKSYNFTTSIFQRIGDLDDSYHLIGLGLKAGLTTKELDVDKLRWPSGMPVDIDEKIYFADVSLGLNWQYFTNSHFSFHLGAAMHHVNKPNISFFGSPENELRLRYNLHGNVEIPIVQRLSVVPSFLYTTQGVHEQLLFGIYGKRYFKSRDTNFVQFGVFAKAVNNFYGNDINTYVLSVMVEINSILFGFSFDRFHVMKSNAYEFSCGYTFGG